MNDDTTLSAFEQLDMTDSSLMRTYTQVVSCLVGSELVERRRQSLRAKLEREKYEREKELENSFISTIRNIFRAG